MFRMESRKPRRKQLAENSSQEQKIISGKYSDHTVLSSSKFIMNYCTLNYKSETFQAIFIISAIAGILLKSQDVYFFSVKLFA